MVTTASIARVAALIGDPTRASMLQALMDGRAGAVAGLARLRLDRPLKKAGARSSPVDADDAAASQGRSRISGAARPPAPSRRTHKRAASGRRPGRVARPHARPAMQHPSGAGRH